MLRAAHDGERGAGMRPQHGLGGADQRPPPQVPGRQPAEAPLGRDGRRQGAPAAAAAHQRRRRRVPAAGGGAPQGLLQQGPRQRVSAPGGGYARRGLLPRAQRPRPRAAEAADRGPVPGQSRAHPPPHRC